MKRVGCVSFCVPDLDAGIEQYTQGLGLALLWRTQDSCGLGLPNDVTEVVLSTHPVPQVQFYTDSVEAALPRMLEAGFACREPPFDIDIGRCAVLADAWGNAFCVLDMTKGWYSVDGSGNVTGVKKQPDAP